MQGKKRSIGWFDICNSIFMILFSLSILYPIWDMLITSVSDPNSSSLTMKLYPTNINLDSYVYAFSNNNIILAYAVTIYRTVAGTMLTLLLISFAAYSLSKKDLPLRNWATTIILIPMFFGGGLIPTYLIIRNLGLVDNLLVYILSQAVSIFSLLIVRNYFMAMDQALEESAFIDGAGYLAILFKIIIPLSKPVLATVALWSMVYHWNAWFDSLIYIQSREKIVLQLILQQMHQLAASNDADEIMRYQMTHPGAIVTSTTFKAAVTIITIGPIILVYPFLQKYFVKGIMMGSLKG